MTPFVLLYFSVPNFRTFAAIAQSVVKYAILKTSMFYKAVGPENIKYSKDSLVKTSMFCKQISACFRWRCRATTISTDMRSQHLERGCANHIVMHTVHTLHGLERN